MLCYDVCMAHPSAWRRRLVTAFGTLGYLFCIFQWLWSMVLFVPPLLHSEAKTILLPPPSAQSSAPNFDFSGPSLLMTGIGIVVTLIVIIITLIILVRLPIGIAKTGHKVAESTAQAVLPIVTHHKKIPEKRRRLLTVRLIKVMKLLLVLVPALLLLGTLFVDVPLSNDLVFMVGGFLAIGSLVWFSLEYVIARWLEVPSESLI